MLSYNELMDKFDSDGSVLGEEIFALRYFPYWHDKKITKNMYYLLTDLKNFILYNFIDIDKIDNITNQQEDIIDFLQGNDYYANVYDVDIHVLNWGDEDVVFQYLVELWNEKHNNGEYLEDINQYDYIFYQRAREEFRDRITIRGFDGITHELPLGNQTRKVINSTRGIGKSVISENLLCWSGLLDPELAMIVMAADDDRAKNFNSMVRAYIKNSGVLEHLKPSKGDKDSANGFNFGIRSPQDSPSVKVAPLYSKKATGSRGDIIVLDDVEVPNNVITEKAREALSERVKEAAAILKTKKVGGIQRIIYLGTPQTEDSLYRKLPDRGYNVRVFPSRIPSEEQFKAMEVTLCPRTRLMYLENPDLRSGFGVFKDRGVSIDTRMNETELYDKELEYKKNGYDMQFMLDPSGSDKEKYPLKLSNLIVADLDKDKTHSGWIWSSEDKYVINDLEMVGFTGDRYRQGRPDDPNSRYEYNSAIMAIDPSGKGKDETAYVILKELHGYLYLLDCGGYEDGYADETLSSLVKKAKFYGVNKIVIEENFGGGAYEKLLSPYIVAEKFACGVEQIWQTKQKELRIIETLEPVLTQHRLVVNRGCIERDSINVPDWIDDKDMNTTVYKLFYQLTRITKDKGALKHDDRLDALALGVQHYHDILGLNTKQTKEDQDILIAADIAKDGLEYYIDSSGMLTTKRQERENLGLSNFHNMLGN